MKQKIIIISKPSRINTGNLVQKLKRIRTELALMVQQCDDALERIEETENTH